MQIEITSPVSIWRAEELNTSEFLSDKEFIGKTFESDDDLQLFVSQFEQEHNCDIESFSYLTHTTEEEDQEEYDAMISSAMMESDETGIPMDHIMGEYLSGMREEYSY